MNKILLLIGLIIMSNTLFSQRDNQLEKQVPTFANLSYGTHEQQAFDIWLPSNTDEPAPLVIHIHGGGFKNGDKKNIRQSSIKQFLEAGFAVAAINYRLSDNGTYPIMMEDAARCLQTIRSRAKEWNLNPDKVACYGGSAGGGISLWLGFHEDLADPGSDDPISRQSTRITAVATAIAQSTYDLHTFREWFGIPDLKAHESLYPFYGVKEDSEWNSKRVRRLMKEASPITHLTKDDVPVYMAYSKGDFPVDKDTPGIQWVHHVKLGLKLQEAMRNLGLECEVKSADHPETKYGSIEAFIITKLENNRTTLIKTK
jgi:acetyl esterase